MAAAEAARVATIVVPAGDLVVVKAGVKAGPGMKDGMKAGRVAVAAGGRSTDSPKSSSRS